MARLPRRDVIIFGVVDLRHFACCVRGTYQKKGDCFQFLFVVLLVLLGFYLVLVAEALALNRILLNCGNQRTLPGVVARVEKLKKILEVAVSYAPWGVLPGNACLLAARALSNWLVGHELSLRTGSNRVHVCVCVSRDVSTPTATEVSVDVRVDVRVHVNRGRHLVMCLDGTNYLGAAVINFTRKSFMVFLVCCFCILLWVYMGLLAVLLAQCGEGVARALLLLLRRDGLRLRHGGAGVRIVTRRALIKALMPLLPLRLPLLLPLRLMSVPAAKRLRLTSWWGRRSDVDAGRELIHRLADGGGVGTLIILEHDVAPCAALLIEGAHNGICVHRGVEVREGNLVVGKSHCCLLLWVVPDTKGAAAFNFT